jgi:hypothetical protein
MKVKRHRPRSARARVGPRCRKRLPRIPLRRYGRRSTLALPLLPATQRSRIAPASPRRPLSARAAS